MRRITLQPIRRYAFLAVLAHGLLGGLIWWWFTRGTSSSGKQTGAHDSLTWVSPADFAPPKPVASTAAQVPVPPEQSAPKSEPSPKPKTAEDPAIKSMLAVAGAVPPAPALPPSRPPLPKAIAIDPAQAKALMEAQQQASAPPPPAEQPKEPVASSLPPIAEAPAPVSDVSRFITVTSRLSEDKSQRLEDVDRAVRDAFMRQWMPPKTSTLNINQRTAHMDMTVDRAGHVLNFTLVKRSGSESFDLSLREAAHRLNGIPVTLPASYPQDHYDFQLHFHVE